LYPEKIGFWVWVLGLGIIPKTKPKTKNFYSQTHNLNPKPKNIYTLTQNPNPKVFWAQTSGVNISFFVSN